MAYVQNGHNGTQAALKAGASPKTATHTASKWVRLGHVQDYIAQLEAEGIAKAQAQAQEAILTPERCALILTELAGNTNNRPNERANAIKIYLDYFGKGQQGAQDADEMLERALVRASEVWDYAESDHTD